MECESSINKSAYLNEYAEIHSNSKKYRNNPNRKIKHTLRFYLIWFILCSNLVPLCILMGFYVPLFFILAVVNFINAIAWLSMLIKEKSSINKYKKNEANIKTSYDLDGIKLTRDKHSTIVSWDSISSIKTYKYSIFFVTKTSNEPTVVVPIENLDNIKHFLICNNLQIPILE